MDKKTQFSINLYNLPDDILFLIPTKLTSYDKLSLYKSSKIWKKFINYNELKIKIYQEQYEHNIRINYYNQLIYSIYPINLNWRRERNRYLQQNYFNSLVNHIKYQNEQQQNISSIIVIQIIKQIIIEIIETIASIFIGIFILLLLQKEY